jgi:predicted ribonuclease YlaK
MAKKYHVLDTNVYLTDPNALWKYGKNDIVLPFKVLEEIDKQKKRSDLVGYNARVIVKTLEEYRKKGSLRKGVRIGKNKGSISTKGFDPQFLPKGYDVKIADNEILAVALTLKNELPDNKVVVISRDINMRLKCDALGIETADYEFEKIVSKREELYSGFSSVSVDDQVIDRFYSGEDVFLEEKLHPNQFVMMISNSDNKKTALARFSNEGEPLRKLTNFKKGVWDVRPRNKEQTFALELLFDPDVPLVSLIGMSGTGKTLMAVAAALEQTVPGRMERYKRMIVSRPIQPMGKDIGYLPGPQPLTAKVMTPEGWRTMGELEVGDKVMCKNGKPATIGKIFLKGKKDVYKITTSDGRETRCCLDHLWNTKTSEERKRGKEGRTRSTREILETLRDNKGKLNHSIPYNEPLIFEKRQLPIAPYTLGVILGDGSISNAVSFASVDQEIVEKVRKEATLLNCDVKSQNGSISHYFVKNSNLANNNKPAKSIKTTNLETGEEKTYDSIGIALEEIKIPRGTLNSRCVNERIIDGVKYEFLNDSLKWSNPFKQALLELNLEGKKSHDKFIPEIYKFSSFQDRLEILRGLLDTDGSIKEKTGEIIFYSSSPSLVDDVREIVYSLGGKATIRSRDRRGSGGSIEGRTIEKKLISYELQINLPADINPFYLSRKAERVKSSSCFHSKIEKIEFCGNEEVKCISIEDEENLYITDDYIVTHNSLNEKMAPWLAPIQDNLRYLLGDDNIQLEEYERNGIIEIEALTYIRGRSISNAFMIIDEAQNLTMHEIKTILTRVGENTKIVLTGDIAQIDNTFVNEFTNGLTNTVEKFKSQEISGHVTMNKGERSNLATIAAKIL